MCVATPQKTDQELSKDHDKQLKDLTWPQYSPGPGLIEYPWEVPEKLGSMTWTVNMLWEYRILVRASL